MSENTISASALRDAIASVYPDVPVTVEQTGGGTATIYVGACLYRGAEDPRDHRFWLAVGPGTYNWAQPWDSTFYFDELCVGPDDDGQSDEFIYAETLDEFVAYIRKAQEAVPA